MEKKKKKRYLGTRRRRASLVLLLGLRFHGILLASLSDKRRTRVDPQLSRRDGIDSSLLRSGASLRDGDDGVVGRCYYCCGDGAVSDRLQPARCQGRRRLPSLGTPRAGDAFHPDARRRTARHAALRRAQSVSPGIRALLEREKKKMMHHVSCGSENRAERE